MLFRSIEITDKGVLKIKFRYWVSAGTWETSWNRYLFRYNKERDKFELIGYASSSMDRGTGEGVDYSINFPAGKMSKTVNPMQNEKAKPEWKKFTLDNLKTLDEIVEPGSWEFMGLDI